MPFHSNELLGGASPYNASEEEVSQFLLRMESVLTEARKLGFEFSTLTNAARVIRPELAASALPH
jgi:hypothetical protein